MCALPTGTVTFLFSDVEGSTRLWEHDPAAMSRAIAQHDELIERSVASNAGMVVRPRGEGDSRFAVFESAAGAISAARDIQEALAHSDWPLPTPLRVRIALHTGTADLRAGDYYGSDVNRCARLRALAFGGQTLISQTTFDLVQDALPTRIVLRDLGEHRLKDLQRPERIFELDVAGLPAQFQPLPSIDAFPNNLPIQITSFVGRKQELKEVEQLLGTAHLLTLTGPGGTGKTRLAMQLAAEVLAGFANGVWLVELAPVTDGQLVPQTVASVLGVPQTSGRPVSETLSDFLRPKKLLLLLDNCEHLIQECAALASKLLLACPGLKIVATSREPLGISGEMIYRVPSLDMPESVAVRSAQISEYGAIRLFVERATSVKRSFRLTEANVAPVVQICVQLDGIPLAIELAAARIKVLSPEQIATRLDDRFRLLTGGSRTALPRQQTLRALIDWSYELLSEPERKLLRRLAVFVGSWALEAAEEACGDDGRWATEDGRNSGRLSSSVVDPPASVLQPSDVLDLLARLVDRSLVMVDETDEDQVRYRLLETIRQYARDKLLEAGEAELLRDRHAKYFSEFTKKYGPISEKVSSSISNLYLQAEEGNILSAIIWAAERDPELALQIGGNLISYRGRGTHTFGMRPALESALAALDRLPSVEGNAAAERVHKRAMGLTALGQIKMAQGNTKDMVTTLAQAIALARQVDDKRLLAYALAFSATASSLLGNFEATDGMIEEGITLARTLDSKSLLSWWLGLRGRVRAHQKQDYAGAQADVEEGVRAAAESGDRSATGMSQITLAGIDILQGRYDDAIAVLQEAVSLLHDARDWAFESVGRSALADAHRLAGHYVEASALYREIIPTHQLSGNLGGIARCLECLAFILIEKAEQISGDIRTEYLRRSARLLGAAEALRETSSAGMGMHEQEEYARYVTRLRAMMDDQARQVAWAEGRGLNMDEVLEEIHD